MKNLAYQRPDGGISIIYPVAKNIVERDLGHELTDAQYEAFVRSRSIPEGVVEAIEIDTIPTDREFRDAWALVNSQISFDLQKAKDIQLERIRKAREPKLLELDKQYMLAIERGEDTKPIVDAKKNLRDITEPLKALNPQSIDEIKAAFPAELRGN